MGCVQDQKDPIKASKVEPIKEKSFTLNIN